MHKALGSVTVTLTNAGYYPIGLAGITSGANKFVFQQAVFTEVAVGTVKVNVKYYNLEASSWQTPITVSVMWVKK